MEWLRANGFWVLTLVAFFALHLFGHGGYGGHGSHPRRDERDQSGGEPDDERRRPSGHPH